MDRIAYLLHGAAHATDRSMRLAYLAEARALLAREAERLRELALLVDAQEKELARQLQQEVG